MDESTRQAGQVGTDRTPDEIRHEIEQTRAELGDTVEALAERGDVKGRAKERIDDLRGSAQDKKDEFVSKAKAQTPESAATGARELAAKAQRKPLPVAVAGALIAGFALGRLSSR